MQSTCRLHKRFVGLKQRKLSLGAGSTCTVLVADTYRSRLLGLAHLTTFPVDIGLYFPKTTSIHTVGMRFPIDLIWLTEGQKVIRVDRNVVPYRFRSCRDADAVIEKVSAE